MQRRLAGPAPYGYKRDEKGVLHGDASTAEVVRRIFNDYAKREISCKALAQALNAEHVPSSTGRAWHASALLEMFKNEISCGRAAGTGCSNRFRFREDIAVLAVIREITERLLAAGRIDNIKAKCVERAAERVAENARRQGAVRTELEDVRKRSLAVADLVVSAKMEGRIAADLWAEQLEDLGARRRHLEQQLDELTAAMKNDHSRLWEYIDRTVEEYRNRLRQAEDPVALRDALRRVCGRIQAMPDHHLVGSADAAGILSDADGINIQVVAGAGFEPATFGL